MSLRVDVVPCFSDNFAYVLSRSGGGAVVVDPCDAGPILAHLERAASSLSAIWVTHHHPDHTSGLSGLLAAFPRAEVVAHASERERVSPVTRAVADGERVEAAGIAATALHVPGHTRGALAFVVEDAPPRVFTGDTLFGAGCGRLFEGTPGEMLRSLERLAALGDDTLVYPGHEYTESNLRFALHVADDAPTRARAERVRALRAEGRPSVPSTMGEERLTNPFLRVRALSPGEPAEQAFAALRAKKDAFRR